MALSDEALIIKGELELSIKNAENEVEKLKHKLATLISQKQQSIQVTGSVSPLLQKAIDDTGKELKKAQKNADDLSKQLERMGKEGKDGVDKVKNELDDTNSIAGKLAGTLGTVLSVAAAKEFAQRIVQTRSQFQQLEVAFTTLLKSEEKANKLIDEAVELAAKTPFDLQGVANGARQLIAYGFASEEVIEDMRRLGDVAAGLGLPLQRLTYLYGTTRVQGRLYSRDMLQFTNSGIPMLDQLAKMYGKTTNEINAMVSAGKIGFEDIKKAIYAMTSEGGQFANLMEKQSKTIGGQISNIGDSLDQMFNEIGKKSEGVINAALSGVSFLVENYEKVGKVLAVVIGAYGAERAALMVAAAARANSTRATIAETAAKAVNMAATGKATAAQMALNKAVLANPYVIATAAVVGLTAWLMKLTKQWSLVAEQQKAMDETANKIDETTTKEIATLNNLNGKLKGAKKGTDAWNKAKAEAVSKFGSYFAELDKEIEKTGNLVSAYDKLRTAILTTTKIRMMDSFVGTQTEQITGAVNKAIDDFEKMANRKLKNNPQLAGKLTGQYANYVMGGDAAPDLYNALTDWNKSFNNLIRNTNDARGAFEGLTDLQKRAMDRFGISQAEYDAYKKGNSSTTTEAKDTESEAEAKKRISAREALNKQVEAAEKAHTDAINNEINTRNALLKDGTAKELATIEEERRQKIQAIERQRKEYIDKLKEVAAAEWKVKNPDSKGTYDDKNFKLTPEQQTFIENMFGENGMLVKDANDAAEKATREALDKQIQEYGDYYQKREQMAREWAEKIAAAEQNGQTSDYVESMKRSRDLELAKADEEEKTVEKGYSRDERRKALEDRLNAELAITKAAYDKEYEMADAQGQKLIDEKKKIAEAFVKLQLAEFDYSEVAEGGDFEAVITALKEKFLAQIETLPEDMKEGTQFSMQEAVDNFVRQFAESGRDIDLQAFYNSLADKSVKALENQLKKAQAALAAMSSDADGVEEAQRQIAVLEAKINELKKSTGKTNMNLADMGQICETAASKFQELGDLVGQNDESTGEMIKTLGAFVGIAGTVIAAIVAITAAESTALTVTMGYLAIVGAVVAAITAVVSIVNANAEANEKSAKAAHDYAMALKEVDAAARLASFSNNFGTDLYGQFKEAKKLTDDARDSIEKLRGETDTLYADMRSGWQKFWGSNKNQEWASLDEFFDVDGNLDIDKMKAFQGTYGEYMTDSQNQLVDDLIAEWERYEEAMDVMNDYLSNLFDNTADNFADAMISAFEETGDAIVDLTDISNSFAKSLAKSMITSTLMEDVFTTTAQDAIKDMLLKNDAAGAVEYYNQLLEQANAKVPELNEFLKNINVDWTADMDERSGESKGIAQASQDSVDELNGRATVIQTHTYQMNENVQAIRAQNAMLYDVTTDILDEVRGIHRDTTDINGKINEVMAGQTRIYNRVDWIADKGVRMN